MASLPKPVSWALRILLVAVIAFVAFNFIRDRDTVVVEQVAAPPTTGVETRATETSEQTTNVERTGMFSGNGNYNVGGEASIVETNGVKQLVFSDDFKSTPGPDLLVYLSKNADIANGLGEFVSLQALKSNDGRQTYTLPESSEDFKSVVIWCRAFNTAFGTALLD